MNTIPDLIPLHNCRPGLRTLLQVEVREASEDSQKATQETKENATGENLGTPGTASLPVLDFIASTATLDRYHEVIEPSGWRLDAYRRNPVFQNAHNYGDILFTLGKALVTEVRAVGERQALCQRIEFATEVNPVARIAYGLYKGGFLNAVSVGFIPLKWEDAAGNEHCSREAARELSTLSSQLSTPLRRRYLEQELLEVSAVAIPANPDALALGLKSGALTKSDLQETLNLLRALVGSAPLNSQPSSINRSQLSTLNSQLLLALARELRRVMRKA
jgi:phage head maturation protease